MTPKEAKLLGLQTYIPDNPCKNGHMGPKRTSNNKCIPCDKMRPKVHVDCKVPGCLRSSHYTMNGGFGYCKSHKIRWQQHGDPLAGRSIRGSGLPWLEDHVNFSGDECLIYPHFKDKYHGRVTFEGKKEFASRMMCILRHGPPPTESHQAAHSCGNGHLGCVNPNHLRWATHQENMDDKFVHGTFRRGSRHGLSKLTEDDVRKIRSLIGKMTQRDIGDMFGVNNAYISLINTGKRWGWLDNYAYPDPKEEIIEKARVNGYPFICEEIK